MSPFGMMMPGRSYTAKTGYRYGFNRKENDSEVSPGDYDFGNRIYSSRLGKWLSVDFLAKSYSAFTPYNFVINNPIKRIDPNGDYEIEVDKSKSKGEQRSQRLALKAYGDAYRSYVQGLGGNELTQLLSHSGYQSKAALLQAWDRKGPGAITLKFSSNTGEEKLGSHQDDGNGGTYLRPDGKGNLTGTVASYNQNVVTLSYTFYGFYNYTKDKSYVSNLLSPKAFDYDNDVNKGYRYISRIIAHEMTHKGAESNNLPDGVSDSKDLVPQQIQVLQFGSGGSPNIYERGQHFEYSIVGSRIRYTDVEYGFAVNVYFRLMGGGSCNLNNRTTISLDQIRQQIRASIDQYMDANFWETLNRGAKEFKGTYAPPNYVEGH